MNFMDDVLKAGKDAGLERSFDAKLYPWSVPGYHPLYSPSCQVIATITFLLVFLLGHYIRPPLRMFLDKVCIHQTDPAKKSAGIQAIDLFISRSKTMLILYNDDYFERLWCTFELAARASENADIVTLPLYRAPAVLAISVGVTLAHVAEYYCIVLYGVDPPPSSFYAVSLFFHVVPFLFMFDCTIRATRQKLRLTQTLRSFKVANTKCFDPKDRVVVERAISAWFSEKKNSTGKAHGESAIDTDAISRFENDVRGGKTHQQIMASIGKQPGLLRMRDLLLAKYMIWVPTAMDFAAFNTEKGFLSALFWNAPLLAYGIMGISLMIQVSSRHTEHWPSWLMDILLLVSSWWSSCPSSLPSSSHSSSFVESRIPF